MSASQSTLSDLHELVAAMLKEDISDPERRTPALMAAAIRFLKDNHIDTANKDELNDLFGKLVQDCKNVDLDALEL